MNTENKLTAEQAIAALDSATNPVNAGKLNRADYSTCDAALRVLADVVFEWRAFKRVPTESKNAGPNPEA